MLGVVGGGDWYRGGYEKLSHHTDTGKNGRKKTARNAESWFLNSSIQPYSFRWICDMLSVDHRAVLKYLDVLRAAPEFDEVMRCNVKSFRTKIGNTRIRTRTGYLLELTEARGKKKAPRGAD
jgi:hypothetical protein